MRTHVTIHSHGVVVSSSGFDVTLQQYSTSERQYGKARVTVPRSHRAWELGVIDPNGGMLVRIGDWYGVSDVPQSIAGTNAVELSVIALSEWVKSRHVLTPRVFRAVPAGVIFRYAVRDAFAGLGSVPLRPGRVVCSTPLLHYEFGRQSLEAVLSFLQGETGHVWILDAGSMEMHWQLSAQTYLEGIVVDQGLLFESLQPASLRDQDSEVIEVDRRTERRFAARSGRVPTTWPSQKVVDV